MTKGKESKKHDAPSCGRGRGGDVAKADAVADLLRDEGVHGVDVDDDLGFHENPLETAAEGGRREDGSVDDERGGGGLTAAAAEGDGGGGDGDSGTGGSGHGGVCGGSGGFVCCRFLAVF